MRYTVRNLTTSAVALPYPVTKQLGKGKTLTFDAPAGILETLDGYSRSNKWQDMITAGLISLTSETIPNVSAALQTPSVENVEDTVDTAIAAIPIPEPLPSYSWTLDTTTTILDLTSGTYVSFPAPPAGHSWTLILWAQVTRGTNVTGLFLDAYDTGDNTIEQVLVNQPPTGSPAFVSLTALEGTMSIHGISVAGYFYFSYGGSGAAGNVKLRGSLIPVATTQLPVYTP